MKEQTLARGLAAFSIGLGIAQLMAPRKLAELIGINDDHDALMRMLGARELASGLGIMQGKPGHFLAARAAGDFMDLGLLAAALREPRNDRNKLLGAITAVATVTALDMIACVAQNRDHSEPGWRVAEPGGYQGAISKDTPHQLRASSDEAMIQHQSGHVYRGSGDTGHSPRRYSQAPAAW